MEKSNRKVIGATATEYDGLKFKSGLEKSCYRKLKEAKLDFSYESERITLWEGTKLCDTKLYAPRRIRAGVYGKDLELQLRTLRNVTYTPDFVVIKGNYKIYFDVKGKENDVYPLKKKMFLKVLEQKNDGIHYMFFEPHNVRQILQAINIIQKL